jgi:hypothetical protein
MGKKTNKNRVFVGFPLPNIDTTDKKSKICEKLTKNGKTELGSE